MRDDQSYFGTRFGHCVSYTRIDSSQIDCRDIAFSLARKGRCSGHSGLSVAQHCFIAAFLMRERLGSFPESENKLDAIFHALLHDAHEAYTNDIPTPLKWCIKAEWQEMLDKAGLDKSENPDPISKTEMILDASIRDAFHLSVPSDDLREAIKACDALALALEMRDLMSPDQRRTFVESGYSFPEPPVSFAIVRLVPKRELEKGFLEMLYLFGSKSWRKEPDPAKLKSMLARRAGVTFE